MQKYQDNIITSSGAPAAFASVAVSLYPSGAAATIYSDNGVTVTANPLTTDINGHFAFYAADGHYSLSISGANFNPLVLTDILLVDDLWSDPNMRGTTANRPATPTLGQPYFDTTLGEPITCIQVSPPLWVNAAGVQV